MHNRQGDEKAGGEVCDGGVTMSHGSNFLRRFAKPETPKKDKTRSIRLPSALEKEFEEHCRGIGINFNEGVLFLIMRELGYLDDTGQEVSVTNAIQTQHEDNTKKHDSVIPAIQREYNRDTPQHKSVTLQHNRITRVTRRHQSGRFTLKPYKIGEDVPCPICGNWQSYKNYARHCRDIHDGMTPQEVIEAHKDIVEQMVREAKGRIK